MPTHITQASKITQVHLPIVLQLIFQSWQFWIHLWARFMQSFFLRSENLLEPALSHVIWALGMQPALEIRPNAWLSHCFSLCITRAYTLSLTFLSHFSKLFQCGYGWRCWGSVNFTQLLIAHFYRADPSFAIRGDPLPVFYCCGEVRCAH